MSIAPLYIAGSAVRTVVRDGPGLVIRQEGTAPFRYPFSRLSRVVSDHRVSWRTDALTGCMSHGVPVFFCNGRGLPIGACYGTRRRETTLSNLLRLTFGNQDAQACLDALLIAVESEAREECAEALNIRGTRRDHNMVVSGATNAIFSAWQVPPGVFLKAYTGLLRSWVDTELLNFLGGDIDSMAFPVPGFHLGERVTAICRWDIFSLLADKALKPSAEEPPLTWACRVFHTNLLSHARAVGRLLGKMEIALRNEVL